MDEAAKDAVLGFAEFQAKPAEASAEVREVAHEIKISFPYAIYTVNYKKVL